MTIWGCMGSENIAADNLNIDTIWKLEVSFTRRPFYLREIQSNTSTTE
jgi:hypothetical protein